MEKTFKQDDIQSTSAEMKVGLLATISPQGLPHITLLSTLRAFSPTEMVWGQFSEGRSKENILNEPRCSWLVLSLDKHFWRGRARFTRTAISGAEFEFFNNTPMFRYNAYFGIHRVYYMDLIEHSGRQPLPMGAIVPAAIKTIAIKTVSPKIQNPPALSDYSRKLMDKIDHLKFMAWITPDGFPQIIPLIQAQSLGRSRVIFSTAAFGDDLRQIPVGAPVAFFAMAFSMEDVLARGVFKGFKRCLGMQFGEIEVNWVYSPMPPKPQQIYPPVGLEAVTEF